jgi:YHS domain-containing protein
MTRTIIVAIAVMALAALLIGCGQKQEQTQVKETAKEVQVVSAKVIDRVCGMSIDAEAAITEERQGKTQHFCSAHCKEQFMQNPAKYMAEKGDIDPVCGMKVDPQTTLKAEYEGKTYHFCSAACKDKFSADPKKYAHCKDHERLHGEKEGHDPKCKHHMEGESHEGHGH